MIITKNVSTGRSRALIKTTSKANLKRSTFRGSLNRSQSSAVFGPAANIKRTRVPASPLPTGSSHPIKPEEKPRRLTLVAVGLVRPLEVLLEQSEDEAVVTDPATGIFGAGDDIPEALNDLLLALEDHRSLLEREIEAGQLSSGLKSQLEYLRDLMVEWN